MLLYDWIDAKEYPELSPMEASEETVNQYIERVLASSHKWSNDEGVHKTLMEIDIEDNIVRAHDKYVRMLYLRLGNALQPHTKIAKAHAATMKEAAFTWQQRAIKLIEEATCNVQIDNKKTIKDIQNEAQSERIVTGCYGFRTREVSTPPVCTRYYHRDSYQI